MTAAERKTEVGLINGTPDKRMFWSIISDYDLKSGICELVDNALDLRRRSKRTGSLEIKIILNVDRQLISVSDNAGGVKEENLRLLVAPGGSSNDPDADVIGIFGVGSKRAGVALGEQVQIRTRFRKERTLEIDITKEWLASPDWELASYEVPDIAPGTTQVDISHLRKKFTRHDVDDVVRHLEETYSEFLGDGCRISVNRKHLAARSFDHWAHPPEFPPQRVLFEMEPAVDGRKIAVQISAGLIVDRNPEAENYGVYFYCNERLIVKELRVREVGYYVTSEAGVPHPDASLCRVVVRLKGSAQLMPWNSSKSGVNFGHTVFQQLRPTVIQLTSHFSSLSRRLKNEWDQSVLPYTSGHAHEIRLNNFSTKNPLVLPTLPRVNRRHSEQLKSVNKSRLHNQPWTLGLVEAMSAVDIISRQKLETKNRIALILLDSNFEIALKEFIVHRTDLFPPREFNDEKIHQLFSKRRTEVIKEVAAKVTIAEPLLLKARHYYDMRNKLIHERATVGVTDADVKNYRSTIEKVLAVLFGLKFLR